MSAPYGRTPNELPDVRLWLMHQWDEGRPFWRVAHAQQLGLKGFGDFYRPEAFARAERRAVEDAALWWVSSDMTDLLMAAVPGVPDDVKGDEIVPPTPAGLVVFEKPWLGVDALTGKHTASVHALAWQTVRLPPVPSDPVERLAWGISSYARVVFDDGLRGDELNRFAGQMMMATEDGELTVAEVTRPEVDQLVPRAVADDMIANGSRTQHGDSVVPAAVAGDVQAAGAGAWGTAVIQDGKSWRISGCMWAPLGRSDWPKDDPIGEKVSVVASDDMHASAVEDRKVLAAFCTLIAQEGITRQEVRPAQRQARRRSERAGVRDSRIRIITLRPTHRTSSAPDDETQHREWSHRWLVNGHWRWQPYGPGRAQRRLTYVRPYVKGPDDKPFQAKTDVRAWVR